MHFWCVDCEIPIDGCDKFSVDDVHLCTLTPSKISGTDQGSKKFVTENKDTTLRLYRKDIRPWGVRGSFPRGVPLLALQKNLHTLIHLLPPSRRRGGQAWTVAPS